MMIRGGLKTLGLKFDVHESYPQAPLDVEFLTNIGVRGTLAEAIETSVRNKV